MRALLFFAVTLLACGSDATTGNPPDGGLGSDTGVDSGGVGGVPVPSFVSARAFAGEGSQYASQVAVDGSGSIYLLGRTGGPVTFSPTVKFAPVDTKYADWFLAKLDPTGAPLWVKGLGGRSSETSARIGLDAAGNVLLVRDHLGALTIDGVVFDNASTTAVMTAIVSFDGAGTIRWSKSLSTQRCITTVLKGGGFTLGRCEEGANGLDFGAGKVVVKPRERGNALFDATGAVQKAFTAPEQQCAVGTADGGMLVGGLRFDLTTVAGTAIPATTGANTVYFASIGPDGAVRHIRSIGSTTRDISSGCRVRELARGERFAALTGEATVDLPDGPFKPPRGSDVVLRLRDDLSAEWKAAIDSSTALHSADSGLTLVSTTSDAFQLLGRTLTGKTGTTSSSRDAIVAGVDATFTTVKWGVRIAEAGNGGPTSAVDPSNGDVVLFGLLYERPIVLDTTLKGDAASDLYVVRVRPPR